MRYEKCEFDTSLVITAMLRMQIKNNLWLKTAKLYVKVY